MNDRNPARRVSILHFAAPPVVGGVENTIYHHARLLAGAGYPVEVIAGRGKEFLPDVPFHCIPEIDSRHPQVEEIGRELAQGRVSPRFQALTQTLVNRLAPILAQSRVCIVHNVMTLHKNLPLTAALRQLSTGTGCRFIAWCHDFAWLDPLYIPGLHPGEPWDLLRTAWPGVRYVVVSEHRQARLAGLLNIPADQIAVVTPGVDAAEFLQLSPLVQGLISRLDLLNAEPLLLLPARITRRKNIEFAIRVMGEIKREKPRASLVVTGPPGPHNPKNAAYLAELNELKERLDLNRQVHFLYQQGEGEEPLLLSDREVAQFYRLADGLLFPSRREGFGIPVLEAGLARLPVFASGIPPVIESGAEFTRRFDPEGDPGAVARMMLAYLAQDDSYRLRKRVLSRFTWQAIVSNQVIPLIEE